MGARSAPILGEFVRAESHQWPGNAVQPKLGGLTTGEDTALSAAARVARVALVIPSPWPPAVIAMAQAVESRSRSPRAA